MITETGNTTDHLFDHPTPVSFGVLDTHLMSQEFLSLQVLCSGGLNHKWKMNALEKVNQYYHRTFSSSSVNSVLASRSKRVRLTFFTASETGLT